MSVTQGDESFALGLVGRAVRRYIIDGEKAGALVMYQGTADMARVGVDGLGLRERSGSQKPPDESQQEEVAHYEEIGSSAWCGEGVYSRKEQDREATSFWRTRSWASLTSRSVRVRSAAR